MNRRRSTDIFKIFISLYTFCKLLSEVWGGMLSPDESYSYVVGH